jgi:uncharacterized protein YndB with AHSA1/START domain
MNTEKDATLETDGPRYTLALERHFAHSPQRVWRVLTEGGLLRQWFPCDVEGGWEVGAPLRFIFLHGEGDGLPEDDLRGEVLDVDEPWLLEFRWGKHLLKYELQADGEGCRFRLSESFDDPSWGARNAAGWEMCLENLDLVIEGVGVLKFAADAWQTKYSRYVRKFEPVFGRQQDPSKEHPLLTDDPAGPSE